MNVYPFRQKNVVPFPAARRIVDRTEDRRRYRRKSDRTFIFWISIMFAMVYGLGYLMGVLSR
jgi:hypothetical protein